MLAKGFGVRLGDVYRRRGGPSGFVKRAPRLGRLKSGILNIFG